MHLCNRRHVRAIPGPKTDLRDGVRIAELLAYGNLPESFIPPRWQRELRDVSGNNRIWDRCWSLNSRYNVCRNSGFLLFNRPRANSPSSSAVSFPAISPSSIARRDTPSRRVVTLLNLICASSSTLPIRFFVRVACSLNRARIRVRLKECEARMAQLDEQTRTCLEPYQDAVTRLDAIPGMDQIGSAVILAEIGPEASH